MTARLEVHTPARSDCATVFGIKAVTSGVPLNTLQQLLRHAQLSTTSIYAEAMGPEKRQLVERMW